MDVWGLWCMYIGEEMGAVLSVLSVRSGAVGAPLWGE